MDQLFHLVLSYQNGVIMAGEDASVTLSGQWDYNGYQGEQLCIHLNNCLLYTSKRRELDKAKLRVREIDGIIQKLYEDNATGKISDERFATMSMSLENEQSELLSLIHI